MKYSLVKIGSKYAVKRTGWPLPSGYLDLIDPEYWWGKGSRYYGSCSLGDHEMAKRRYDDIRGEKEMESKRL